MSFLDSVLTSLQTGKPCQLPVSQPPAPPVTPSTIKKDVRKPAPAPAPAPRVPSPNGNPDGGRKRKAENQLAGQREPKLASKPAPSSSVASSQLAKAAPKPAVANSPKPASKNGTTATTKACPPKAATSAPAKPPPKNSYAALMQRAKELQEKGPQNVGTILHQPVPKKDTRSWQEHKQRLKEAKAEARARRAGRKYVPKRPPPPRRLSQSQSPPVPSYKGTAKPAKSAQTPEKPAYRGTAGLPAKRSSNERSHAKRRANEYLGTDEEDEGDYGDYDGHPSDASSDMEAGFGDVDHEEGAALKSAQREDEKELRMEMAAKKEKLERQRKLAALVSRKR